MLQLMLIRTLLLYKIFTNSKDTAIAKVSDTGESICGNCRKGVEPHAVKCQECQSHLHTRRGKMARKIFFFGGIGIFAYAYLIDGSGILFIIQTSGLILVGVYCLYIWFQLRSERPNRTLNLREKMKF